MSKYLLAIPFYKNEQFIEKIIHWFNSPDATKDRELISKVLVINDCPASEGGAFLRNSCESVGFSYVENSENMGYLRTANSAYGEAKSEDVHLVLLNSDTIPFPGFLFEMNKCFEQDSMLGIVSARSNNATICNMYDRPFYYEDERSSQKFQKDRVIFQKYLPDISYVPVVTGFCFAIRRDVIKIFDGFDSLYTVGYEEENDFCLRVSERGYRIGIANKAFVVHLEGKSFGLTSFREKVRKNNALILRDKYPYYDGLITGYSGSTNFRLTSMVSRACTNETRFLIDARVLAPCHNGSNKLIVEFLKALSCLGIDFDLLCNHNALDYHGVEKLPCLNLLDSPSEVYEYGFMLGQPMLETTLWTVPAHSLVSVCIFFDTIAHDCPQLKTDNPLLDAVWSRVPYVYTDVSFISRHSLNQFELKFGRGSARLHTHLLPLDTLDVIDANELSSQGFALIFGNKFLHKGIDLLLDELPVIDGFTYKILGNQSHNHRPDFEFYAPGEVPADAIDTFMKSANFILMPSFAEGFGFPLLEALRYRKPIYCREIPCFREIRDAAPLELKNLIRFVQDFKLIPECYSVPCGESKDAVFADFSEYVREVISDVEVDSSERFFAAFKGRLMLIGGDENSGIDLPFITEVLLKFYRFLLTTPASSLARKAKSIIFSSTNIKTYLFPKEVI